MRVSMVNVGMMRLNGSKSIAKIGYRYATKLVSSIELYYRTIANKYQV